MVTAAVGIVAFGLGVAFSAKIKSWFTAQEASATTAVKAEESKVIADIKAKV